MSNGSGLWRGGVDGMDGAEAGRMGGMGMDGSEDGRAEFPLLELEVAKGRVGDAPEERRGEMWREITLAWAEALREAFELRSQRTSPRRAPYRVDASERIVVISSLPEGAAGKWPGFGEWVISTVMPFLEPIGAVPPWPIVVCLIHEVPTFDAYLAAVGTFARLLPAGGYLCGDRMMPHIAILGRHPLLALRLIFTHELIHAVIHRPGLPLWIEEGVCRDIEKGQLRMHNLVYLSHVDVSQNQYWRRHNLGSFWSGRAFSAEGGGHAYVLANRIVRRLIAENLSRFYAFVQKARSEDAGDAAAREVYGRPILEIAREFVGAGDWVGPGCDSGVGDGAGMSGG